MVGQVASLGSDVEVVSEALEMGAPGRIHCMCKGPGYRDLGRSDKCDRG